jgi:uncharacterized membrane protein YfcA
MDCVTRSTGYGDVREGSTSRRREPLWLSARPNTVRVGRHGSGERLGEMMLLIWGSVCIGMAAVVGGATGFGAALIAAPFMLLVGFNVEDVVIINLVAGVVTRIGVSLRLRAHIDWRRVTLLAAGSLPGACLGALPVLTLPEQTLKQVVGLVVVLCGLGMAAARLQQPYVPSARAQVAAGFLSGYLSTTTSLNGPPIVLLLARAGLPPLAFIADLAAYFTLTNALSLLILVGRGPIPTDILQPALPVLLVIAMIGNFLGLRVARKLPAQGFRAIVIGLVIIVGALTAIMA